MLYLKIKACQLEKLGQCICCSYKKQVQAYLKFIYYILIYNLQLTTNSNFYVANTEGFYLTKDHK